MHVSSRRRLAAVLIPLAAAAAAAAPASAAPVAAGSLEWNTVNVYGAAGQTPTNRTWLGYITGTGPGQGQGTATPSAPATGPTVTTTSERGADQAVTWSYPLDTAVANTFDPATKTGVVEFDGNVRFHFSPGGPSSFDVDLQDPRIELDGDSGKLYASGASAGSESTYDRSAPVFDLDLTNVTPSTTDRVTTLDGIVASIATASRPFPSNYAVGAGPERDPDTFGSFDLSLTEAPVVTASKTTDIAPGEKVTVSGSGFKTTVGPQGDLEQQGLYLALVGPDFDTQSMDSPSAATTYVPGAVLQAAGGSFTKDLTLPSSFGTGADAVDCLAVACKLYVWKAHVDADPSQRVAIPVTFKVPVVQDPAPTDPTPVTPAPVVTATATPTATAPPTPTTAPAKRAAPKASKVKVGKRAVRFRLSRAGTAKVTIAKRVGKKWKVVKRVTVKVKKATTVTRKVKLGKGRFRVSFVLTATDGTKGKAVAKTVTVK